MYNTCMHTKKTWLQRYEHQDMNIFVKVCVCALKKPSIKM